jgi:hypothetical protein
MTADLRASQLVGMGLCTPQCLLSTGTEVIACGCECRGRWHGVLAAVRVPDSSEARPAPPEPHAGQEDGLVHMELTDDERAALGLPVDEQDVTETAADAA